MKGYSTKSNEKRAFTRRTVRLEALCITQNLEEQKIEIRDFCPGGMLLAYSATGAGRARFFAPAYGDLLAVDCIVPTLSGSASLRFRGKVVRTGGDSVGLAFVDPDLDALHVLHEYSKRVQAETEAGYSPAVSGTAAGLSDHFLAALLEDCRQKTIARLQPMVIAFLEQVKERLYSTSGLVQSLPEKNAYYDTMNIFERRGDLFMREFERELKLRLSELAMSVASPFSRREFTDNKLSLVEEDTFEEWLAFSDLARTVETECQEILTDFSHRLSVLLKRPIHKENNPFAPITFGQAFQAVLKGFPINRMALPVTYGVFRDVLLKHLTELYHTLNQHLIESGILPELRLKYQVKQSTDRAPQSQQPIALHKLATPKVSAAQDWYRLVQNLENLHTQVSRQNYAEEDQDAPLVVPESSARFYDAEQVLRALSRLSEFGHSAPAQLPGGVKAQVLNVLSHEEPSSLKALPGREEKILNVAETLFESVLADQLVSNNVRPWLQQLSIPMFKTAIRDDSVFVDKSHLIRQVINNIAELEFYGEGDSDKGQNAVRKRINDLLSEIASTDSVSPEVFNRVLKELSLLVRIQNKAYEENLKEVVAAAETEEKVALRANNRVHPAIVNEELREWVKRAERLKPGDSLLLNVNGQPQRLKLAWVGKNRARYIFVNVKGLKELTLSGLELAEQLREGSAIVLDDGGEPLLDRAQYNMLQKMHRDLLRETTHDHLTGLLNRREFERRVTEALASARQNQLEHAICYMDLDQFNVVNNTFGYEGGDKLLTEISALLNAELGDRGVLARIGGDEFAMLLQNCPIEEALRLISLQKTAVGAYRFSLDQKSLSISFSAGLVTLGPNTESVLSSLQAAEASCRIARDKGTNYIQVYNPEDSTLSRHMQAMKWVTRIDQALDEQSLELRYQPIAQISGDHLSPLHAEILLGVQDEQGKLISPAEFVLAAEHFRRMSAVDRWVVERVFRWMVQNPDKLETIGGLAINLSGSSLNEEDFVNFITEQAKTLRVPMDKVCFEITETAGIANLSNASEFILAVKELGCLFSLDDFGSGLSSYAYLKNLPVDYLKIDGAFVKNMDQNPYDYAVVKSITEIGHFMGKKIIAECVENDPTLVMLRSMGVDYAQGYLISKPLPLLR